MDRAGPGAAGGVACGGEVAITPPSCLFVAWRQNEDMNLAVETEQEADGRWIAEIAQTPSALSYGVNCQEAVSKVEALALRVLADRLERGEMPMELEKIFSVAA